MNRSAATELSEVEYRPISFLAIFSLFVSLFSLAVFVNIGFILFCVLSLSIAIFSLWRIHASDRDFVGGNFAWAAIFICCFSGMFGICFFTMKHNHRWTAAREHADHWLKLMQAGEYEKVHHMTLPVEDREGPETSLADYYHPDNLGLKPKMGRQPQTGYLSYWEMLVPQKLIKADGEKCRIEFVKQIKIQKIPGGELYRLVYRYYPADKSLKRMTGVGRNNATITFPLEFEIQMHRAPANDKVPDPQWHVFQVRVEDVHQTNEERRND